MEKQKKDQLAESLGYTLQAYDEKQQPIYMKNNLKWITCYAELNAQLQTQQQEELSFDDFEYRYGYNIDDYFFYHYQDQHPNELSTARQLKWKNQQLAIFINIFDECLNDHEITNQEQYLYYKRIENSTQPVKILLLAKGDSIQLYQEIQACAYDVKESVKKALAQGYQHYFSSQDLEFKPLMYRKSDHSKWIHHIEYLAPVLDLPCFNLLEEKGYNLNDYYEYNCIDKNTAHYQKWYESKNNIPKIKDEVYPLFIEKTPSKEIIYALLSHHLSAFYPSLLMTEKQKKQIVSDLLLKNIRNFIGLAQKTNLIKTP